MPPATVSSSYSIYAWPRRPGRTWVMAVRSRSRDLSRADRGLGCRRQGRASRADERRVVCEDRPVRGKRFTTTVATDGRGRAFVPVPFDPDLVWGPKPRHHIAGTIHRLGLPAVLETPGTQP